MMRPIAQGSTTFFFLVGLALCWAMPVSAAPAPPRHVVLYYLSSSALTTANVRPLVGYVDSSGKARDWMFDGMIIYDIHLYQYMDSSGVQHPNKSDIDGYRLALFDKGGLSALAQAVTKLRQELKDPTYRLKIYFTATCTTKDAHGNPYVDALLNRWNTDKSKYPPARAGGLLLGGQGGHHRRLHQRGAGQQDGGPHPRQGLRGGVGSLVRRQRHQLEERDAL